MITELELRQKAKIVIIDDCITSLDYLDNMSFYTPLYDMLIEALELLHDNCLHFDQMKLNAALAHLRCKDYLRAKEELQLLKNRIKL